MIILWGEDSQQPHRVRYKNDYEVQIEYVIK